MLVSTNIGKHISKPKKGEFLYNFFPGDRKQGTGEAETGGPEISDQLYFSSAWQAASVENGGTGRRKSLPEQIQGRGELKCSQPGKEASVVVMGFPVPARNLGKIKPVTSLQTDYCLSSRKRSR